MIKKITLLFCIAFTVNAWSQQDGYQTHFQFNEMSYNPSYAGKVKDKMCVSLLMHQQWAGFKSDLIKNADGTPAVEPYNVGASTQFFNISARLFSKFGIAMNVVNDKIGPQTYIIPKLSLAYYQVFKNTSELSFGLYYGKLQKSLDGTKLKALSVLQNGTVDPAVPSSLISSNLMNDLGVGIHYVNPIMNDLNIGFSAVHLLSAQLFDKTGGFIPSFSSITMHYYGNASMDFMVGTGSVIVQPNLLVKYGNKLQLDANVIAYFNQQYYGGLSYRQGDNINLMVGFMQGDFKVGYAFDFVVNGLKPGSRTTHELFIQYCKGLHFTGKVNKYMLNPRHLRDSKY
ncbi:MAG: PorP/SprF family type IX secretion system membrane protein [Bacteroidetes bacterium]|nr:PorP/SprF family type IX secretion system membrane protein [Bacteroidota bacterium]